MAVYGSKVIARIAAVLTDTNPGKRLRYQRTPSKSCRKPSTRLVGMMLFPHIHSMHDFYEIIGSLVVGYFASKILDWFKHAFWVGFKSGLQAQLKKGAPLTPEETAALKQKINAQLMAEYQKKLLKVADVVSDDEPVQN
jgi:hypothetical protein